MADKFLESIDMEEFVEGMKMTRLGEMLVKEGREAGLIRGRNKREKRRKKRGKRRGNERKGSRSNPESLGVLDDEVLMEKLHISKERLKVGHKNVKKYEKLYQEIEKLNQKILCN